MESLGEMVRDICYRNAVRYFGIGECEKNPAGRG